MLALQWSHIAAYPKSLKDRIHVIIVDDASAGAPAAAVSRPQSLPEVSIFRISRDIRWNQDAARNIGAFEASTPWLLLTDIDHVVPAETLQMVLDGPLSEDKFYTFGRVKLDGGGRREPHPNSYLMTRSLYWEIGGHDEDFAGIYGKDFLFRKRAERLFERVHLENVVLARVGTTMVPDAGTTTITRANSLGQRIWGYLLEWLKTAKLWRGVQTLRHSYEREL